MNRMNKFYLGDSVYVAMNDCGQIVLTTENDLPSDPSNEIFLEPEVFAALVRWHKAQEAA